MLSARRERGDTIVEVLFAITVFSLVAVGSLLIMNQGTATAQRALEITLVRQEIDAQASALRFLNMSYISAFRTNVTDYSTYQYANEWVKIYNNYTQTGKPTDLGGQPNCPSKPAKAFVLNARKAILPAVSLTDASTFSQLTYVGDDNLDTAEGIWIEAYKFEPPDGYAYQKNAGYVDFHIRACWESPGMPLPITLGTIVRLYEPL